MTATERMFNELNRQNKTSAQLCRWLEIKSNTLANWKSTNTIPPSKYLVSICEFLNVSTDWLLTGNSNRLPLLHTMSSPDWCITDEDREKVAEIVKKLPEDLQVLVLNYNKLEERDKEEIRLLIAHKIKSKPEGLLSNSQILSAESSGGETA